MAWWSYRCLENPRPKGGILANGKRHLSISGRTNTSPCPLCPIFVTSVFNLFLFFSSVGACFPRRQKRSKLTLRMPRVSREEFVSCLTKGKPVPALLLLGDEPFLDDPAPFTVLVLEATALDLRMKLAKLLAEKALVVEVGLGEDLQVRQAAAVPLARSLAKEQGVDFEPGAAEDLAEFVAADLMRLKTEIDKLSTYVGNRKLIRRQDVTALVISEKTTTVWELADLLASRQQKRALEFLDRLLRDGEEPLQMLGAITWMYRKLIEASELKGISNGYQAA